MLEKHEGSAKSGCQEWFCHSYEAQTLHAGFSCHIWCEFTLVGDARLLTMWTTVLNLSRGQAQHRCYQLSDVPLWGCLGNETEARPFMCWNYYLHIIDTMLITILLPGCFAGCVLYSRAAFHLLFRPCRLAVLFLYNTYHQGTGENDPSSFPPVGFSLFHPHPDLSAVSVHPQDTYFSRFSLNKDQKCDFRSYLVCLN